MYVYTALSDPKFTVNWIIAMIECLFRLFSIVYCNDWVFIQAVFNCLLQWLSVYSGWFQLFIEMIKFCFLILNCSLYMTMIRLSIHFLRNTCDSTRLYATFLLDKVKKWQYWNQFSCWPCRIDLATIQSWYCCVCLEDKEAGKVRLCSHNLLHRTLYCCIYCLGPTTMGSALKIHS
jgi:hypothetical protein